MIKRRSFIKGIAALLAFGPTAKAIASPPATAWPYTRSGTKFVGWAGEATVAAARIRKAEWIERTIRPPMIYDFNNGMVTYVFDTDAKFMLEFKAPEDWGI